MTATPKQGLVDLLTRIGDAALQFQNLDQCTKRSQSVRGGVHITFGTSVVTATELMLGTDEHMGLVVWAKRADVEAARAAFTAEHRPFVSCECPAAKGEACPLPIAECNAREAERRAARNG